MGLKRQLIIELREIRFPRYASKLSKYALPEVSESASVTQDALSFLEGPTDDNASLTPLADKDMRVWSEEHSRVGEKQLDSTHILSKSSNDYIAEAKSFEAKLKKMTISKIQELYGEEIKRNRIKKAEVQRAYGLSRDQDAFFNDFDADADFNEWAKKTYWTAREAAALFLLKEPKLVNSATLASYDPDAKSPFRKRFIEILEQIRRARDMNEFRRDKITPREFIMWAERRSLKLPDAMLSACKIKLKNRVADKKTRPSTFYRIVLGICISKHGFDASLPFGRGNQDGVVSGILKDLASAGDSMDDKTLRSALNEAREWLQADPDNPVWRKMRKKGGSSTRSAESGE